MPRVPTPSQAASGSGCSSGRHFDITRLGLRVGAVPSGSSKLFPCYGGLPAPARWARRPGPTVTASGTGTVALARPAVRAGLQLEVPPSHCTALPARPPSHACLLLVLRKSLSTLYWGYTAAAPGHRGRALPVVTVTARVHFQWQCESMY